MTIKADELIVNADFKEDASQPNGFIILDKTKMKNKTKGEGSNERN